MESIESSSAFTLKVNNFDVIMRRFFKSDKTIVFAENTLENQLTDLLVPTESLVPFVSINFISCITLSLVLLANLKTILKLYDSIILHFHNSTILQLFLEASVRPLPPFISATGNNVFLYHN